MDVEGWVDGLLDIGKEMDGSMDGLLDSLKYGSLERL